MIKVGLVFSISNFFDKTIAQANIWMSFGCGILALEDASGPLICAAPCPLQFT